MNASPSLQVADLRRRILGLEQHVPLLDGRLVTYVNLDNAASTPPLRDVMDTLERFLPHYSSVHRGTGFKSRLSTAAYDQAHHIIARFVGANPQTNTVIFGKNTTEAINKLSYRFPLPGDAVVLTTLLEHHSNDLPWRHRTRVVHVRATPDGRLDEDDFDRQLARHAGRVALVSVTGASNVTGFLLPIHRLARKAHAAGAKILVDAAQLAPHRRVDMKPDDDPEHLDFVALSGHKMYAPFGTGALIGPTEVFLQGGPEYPGGGTVEVVTPDEVHWAGMPDRDEAGSPNVVGAVAMAAAAQTLMAVGMEAIAAHEEDLIAYSLQQLQTVPGIKIYGQTDPRRAAEKVGAIPFNLSGVSHFLVAAILGYEGGIGVRSGCFCAHPYVVHLLNLAPAQAAAWRDQMLRGDKSNMPGMVRMSFGCYNNRADVERLVSMLKQIAAGDYRGDYRLNRATGEYTPANSVEPPQIFAAPGQRSV
ncbi:MAG: aminotransferase class V-fold PLP-dependent enzyme [Anaerolineae bacterium]